MAGSGAYGRFNFLVSDGDALIAYGGDRLHRLQCHDHGFNTQCITSDPLTDDASWEAFRAGELRVYRKDDVIGSPQASPARTGAVREVNDGS